MLHLKIKDKKVKFPKKIHRSVAFTKEYVDEDRDIEGESFEIMKKKYTRFKSVDTALPTLRS